MSKVAKEPEKYLVVDGFDTPDDRFNEGAQITLDQIPEKSRGWMVKDGHVVPLTGAASPAAIELGADYDVPLGKVDGSGKDGQVTKPDVQAYIDEHDLEPVDG